MKPIIIYSHGFGVRKDDRGLFTEIAAVLPKFEHIMFDYGSWNDESKELTIPTLTEQMKHLGQVISETKAENPDSIIELICHSQGCVVAALLRPQGIHKAIFTGPPAELSVDNMLHLFKSRPGSEINLHGISHLKRADFSTTNVSPEYWQSINSIDPIALYNEYAETTSLTIINAAEDEIIGSCDFSRLTPEIKLVEVKTGHNFENAGRQQLIDAIKQKLVDVK